MFDIYNPDHFNIILNSLSIIIIIFGIITVLTRLSRIESIMGEMRNTLIHRSTHFQQLTAVLRDFFSDNEVLKDKFKDLHEAFGEERIDLEEQKALRDKGQI